MVAELNQLALISQARRAIEKARTLGDVKKAMSIAESIRICAKKQGDCLDVQNYAAEAKLRAQRKAGSMIAAMRLRGGNRKSNLHDESLKLSDLGVAEIQSHRWQRIASLPDRTFETYIEETLGSKDELTTAGALRLAKTNHVNGRKSVVMSAPSTVTDLQSLIDAGEKFGTIYADPPWQYGNQATRASTSNHYRTMTVDEIAALPIGQLAADQAHLWLWTTNGFLFECPRLFEAWGFEFKSSYVWVKPQIGIGNYLRNSHEFLLLAVKGKLVGAAKDVRSWGEFERGTHSAKPEQIRRTVIERVSPGQRLELFGRGLVDGWTVWGNQITRTIFDTEAG